MIYKSKPFLFFKFEYLRKNLVKPQGHISSTRVPGSQVKHVQMRSVITAFIYIYSKEFGVLCGMISCGEVVSRWVLLGVFWLWKQTLLPYCPSLGTP